MDNPSQFAGDRDRELVVDRLVIPGPDGRPRIELGLDAGYPALRFFDPDGHERVRLSLSHDLTTDLEFPTTSADLVMTATDDGGQVRVSAANAGSASIHISGKLPYGSDPAGGAWIEVSRGSLEASVCDALTGVSMSWDEGRMAFETTGNGVGSTAPRLPGQDPTESAARGRLGFEAIEHRPFTEDQPPGRAGSHPAEGSDDAR